MALGELEGGKEKREGCRNNCKKERKAKEKLWVRGAGCREKRTTQRNTVYGAMVNKDTQDRNHDKYQSQQ